MWTARPTGSFDLVYARLILINIPDPERVVAEMVRLVKPGGWIACEEGDGGAMLCQPPHPAYTRLTDTFKMLYRQDGADILVGRRLPQYSMPLASSTLVWKRALTYPQPATRDAP